MSSISSQLVSKFGPKADEPSIIQKCEELISLFGLSAEDLFLKWESFVITTSVDNDIQLTVENLDKLRDYVQKQLAKTNNHQKTPAAHVKRTVIRTTPNMSMTGPSTPLSSLNKRRKLQGSTPRSDASFVTAHTSSPIHSTPSKNTAKSGEVLESLNADNIELISEEPQKPRIVANFDPAKYKYRTMNQKLLEVADYLDEQIDDAAKAVLKHYKFEQSEFGNPTLQSQTEILAVGRIVPDSPLTDFDADLNLNSLMLETSRSGGIGQRVRIDVSGLSDYSLFPGQIVCVRGINPTGNIFKVTGHYDLPYLGAPVTSAEDIEAYSEQMSGSQMKLVVTAGPYTSNRELDYSLLEQFVDRMNSEVKPSTIIMFGPFLDVTHRQIEEGTLDFPQLERQPKNLDEVFKLVIAPILRKLTCHQVILIPSTRDATTKHAAYPQEMFDRKSMGLSKHFKCFPNPATFSLNEMLVGCSNNDVFHDMKDLNSGSYVSKPRFNRIAEHVLEQGRYYPTFPGGYKKRNGTKDRDRAHVSGADLQVSYMGLSEFPGSLPDVLIIPSDLKYFVKVVKNVVVLNPGSFIKMNSQGTYAQLLVGAPKSEELTKVGHAYLNEIWKRARVDIVRV